MEPYNHHDIEKKWQKVWSENHMYDTPDSVSGKENYYALTEFSYPSGNLHVGHWYAFSVPDIYVRYMRMRGYNVLFPTGFDAFGLPAENAAIKLGEDPKTWTHNHMEKMRNQLRSMGTSFDWSREVVTCDPDYYKWTQWMFNQFLKNDLAYRAATQVNWCPKDMTILANEQVINGTCERCQSVVEQRNQEQWMLRITRYADQLIDDLDELDWPHAIKEAQRNWIGRSEGAQITFEIFSGENSLGSVDVFTTRADTLFGVTYIVLAPEHPILRAFREKIGNYSDVEKYQNTTKQKSELDRQQSKEKTGVALEGIYARNPGNGELVPVWIADYVLVGYGTGAVMAVPAHDERDFEFAKKYELPVKNVIQPVYTRSDVAHITDFQKKNKIVSLVEDPDGNILTINWGKELGGTLLLGGTIEEGETPEETALRELSEETGYYDASVVAIADETFTYRYFAHSKNTAFEAETHFVHIRLNSLTQKDQVLESNEQGKFTLAWLSPQDATKQVTEILHVYAFSKFLDPKPYTGEGIVRNSIAWADGLLSHDARDEIVSELEYKGLAKEIKTYRLRDWGISRQRYWGVPIPIVYDPEGVPHPIPDEHLPWLLPTDVDHTPDGTAPLARSKELRERTEKIFGPGWRPEVETMDTFVDSTWYFYRYLDSKNQDTFCNKEKMRLWMPIDIYMGGAEHTTMHVLYSRFWTKALHDLGLVNNTEEFTIRRNRGLILGPDGEKMSKSKGNVINPDEVVDRLGADTVRMYLAFMGPYNTVATYPWDPNGVVGVRRFLERVWRAQEYITSESSNDFSKSLHKAIRHIDEDMREHKFNTAIAQMMIIMNVVEKEKRIGSKEYALLLCLLAPFAPHITEELWQSVLGNTESIHLSSWPVYDTALAHDTTVVLGVQINGKVRGEVELAVDASEEDVREKVFGSSDFEKYIEGKEVKKFIYIPGKIISIVL